jgi:hypothetical protein
MKIKVNTQLKGAKGEPLSFPKPPTVEEFVKLLPTELQLKILPYYIKEKEEPRLLRDVCLDTILIPFEGDDEKAKLTKYDIYKKLLASKDEVDLPAEQITVVKNCISKFQPQLIMGQCWELIESGNTSVPKNKK